MDQKFYLTKLEYTRIIGDRAEQLSRGAPTEINVGENNDPIEIAMKEYKEKKIPLILIRKLPNNKEIKIPVSQSIYID